MKQSQNGLEIAILGDERVGKTYFVNKISKSRVYKPTIGVFIYSKQYQIYENNLIVDYWDLPSQRDWNYLLPKIRKRFDLFIIVYDVTNRSSFQSIERWRNKINQDMAHEKIIILIANKIDTGWNRAVSYNEGKSLADRYEMLYLEVSCSNGKGCENFEDIIWSKLEFDNFNRNHI